jgi:hypothetical protein
MKKIYTVIALIGMIACTTNAKADGILGTWNYTAEHAPYEYQKGQVVFFEEDGETQVKVVIGEYTLDGQDLELEGSSVEFVVFVDYEPIAIELELKNEKMTGNIDTPEGLIPILLVKADKSHDQDVKKALMGTWDYSAEYAPSEYLQGQMIFSYEDGETIAQLVIGDSTLNTQDLMIEGAKIECVVFVEYEPVIISLELKDGNLAGSVDSSGGVMPISMVKAKK